MPETWFYLSRLWSMNTRDSGDLIAFLPRQKSEAGLPNGIKKKKNNSRCQIKGRKWPIAKMCSGLRGKETEKHFIHFYAHEHGMLWAFKSIALGSDIWSILALIMKGRLKAASDDQIGKRSRTVPPPETMTLVDMALNHKRMLLMLVLVFLFLKACLPSPQTCMKIQW